MPSRDPKRLKAQREKYRKTHAEEIRAYHKARRQKPEVKAKLKLARKRWLQKHPEWRSLQNRKCLSKRNAAFRAWIEKIKLERGCEEILHDGRICGYREHAVALDFDHIPGNGPKCFSLAQGNRKPMALVLTEISKCEVICANCHRVRTWRRKQFSHKAGRA